MLITLPKFQKMIGLNFIILHFTLQRPKEKLLKPCSLQAPQKSNFIHKLSQQVAVPSQTWLISKNKTKQNKNSEQAQIQLIVGWETIKKFQCFS